jgi:Icc-related predicted phosphoesterase
MKVQALSDIHGLLIKPSEFEECDIICICGDIMPLEIDRNIIASTAWFVGEFIPWCEKLPCKYVLFTPGNHDFLFDELYCKKMLTPMQIMKMLLGNNKKNSKVKLLIDSSFEYEGKRFYGTPWCPNLSHWAFYKDSYDLEQVFKQIPWDADVVMTHCPSTIGDSGTVLQQGWNFCKRLGCEELTPELFDRQSFIKYALCGHIHSGDHNPIQIGQMKVVNVSILSEEYKRAYSIYKFEL